MVGALVGALWVAGIVLVSTRHRESARSRVGRIVVALTTGGVIAAAIGASDALPAAVELVGAPIVFVAGAVVYQSLYRKAAVVNRTRLQWVAWGVVVFAAVASAA